jgi:hypothetical protein
MGLKNLIGFRIVKTKGKHDGTAEVREALATKIAVLEEQVNSKTKKLEQAERKIKNLAVAASTPQEDAPPRPHGPLVELEVEPTGGGEADGDTNVGTLLGEATEEAKTTAAPVATTAPETPAATATPSATKEAKKEEDDSLSNLFRQEEDEENPLAALISSLPDVSTRELLDDLQEIKEIIQESRLK